jgi:hypothetical protein
MDILARIKRLVLNGKVLFTRKAEAEIAADHLSEELVCEAIINAPSISKTLRSRNPLSGEREKLYIIKGLTFDGLLIYTKGKISKIADREIYYVLISSKKAID